MAMAAPLSDEIREVAHAKIARAADSEFTR
jgi:hypothetical protein